MPKNTGLGKGLDAIFLDNSAEESTGTTVLRISDIEPKASQPRKKFDNEKLAMLADSIAIHGLLQPIIVRVQSNGFYQIVAGERRWRAAKMAGLTEVPVIVMETDDKSAAELALIENIQRESLNPVDEAGALQALIDEYGMTQEDISKRIGKSRSAVANSLRLLDLPDEVMELINSGDLTAGHARTLLGIKEPDAISDAAELVVKKGLSVRETEELVKKLNAPVREPQAQISPERVYLSELETRMQSALGRKVKITSGSRTHKLELQFENNDDLEALIKRLCGNGFFEGI